MKRRVLIAVWVCIILVSCSSNIQQSEIPSNTNISKEPTQSIPEQISAPDEKDIWNMVPEELLKFTYEGQESISSVIDVTIVRQQTNEKSDVCECNIVLKGDYLKLIKHIYDLRLN